MGRGKTAPRNLTAVKHIFSKYQWRARNRGQIWNLSLVYFQELIGRACIYCERPPGNIYKGPLGFRLFYQGVDRVINDEGYTEGNTVPCCKECNAIKSNILNASEMLAAMRAIKKVRK